jgi:hypothetical protein
VSHLRIRFLYFSNTCTHIFPLLLFRCKDKYYFPNFQIFGRGKSKWGRKDLWYGIIAGASPRMTAEQTADGEIEALEGAMLDDSLTSILATGGGEAAGRR